MYIHKFLGVAHLQSFHWHFLEVHKGQDEIPED